MANSPRRKIVSVERVGDWGNYQYQHTLECGHVVLRKRTCVGKINCSDCVLAASKQKEMESLSVVPVRTVTVDVDDYIPLFDDTAVEVEAGELRAGLAKRFGVSAENIDVVLTDDGQRLVVDYALVYLSSSDAKRLAKNG